MKRKKILWLCSWYPSKGDPFNGDFIQRHARAASIFHDITVIHVYADSKGTRNELTVETHNHGPLKEIILSFRKKMSFPGRLRAHHKLLSLYRRAINEYIRANGKPDLVHVHVPIWAGKAALRLKKENSIQFVVTEHWGIYNDVELHNYHTKSRRFKRTTKKIFRQAAAFLSVSRFLAEGVNRFVIKKDYELFPNVVDTDHFFPVNKETALFRFIHVSTMVALKNTAGILSAFSGLLNKGHKAELVMAGPVPPGLVEKVRQFNIPEGAIRFTGEISYEEVGKEMRSADCFVLFSNIENSPCVIGEALCCGLPVISSAVGGVPELVDETNSILVKPGDEDGLLQAMEKMVMDRRSFNSGNIATKAAQKFSYQSVGRIMDELYSRLSS